MAVIVWKNLSDWHVMTLWIYLAKHYITKEITMHIMKIYALMSITERNGHIICYI
jgi:hypothetical protein